VNKIILVIDPAKAAYLEEIGFKSCGVRRMGNKTVSQFIETKELIDVLNDPAKFNVKDYLNDSRLTF
jgi:hypothetical protein